MGNRELTGSDFVWVPEAEILAMAEPEDLVRVVRSEYGDAFGRIVGAVDGSGAPLDLTAPSALVGLLEDGAGMRRERRRLEGELEKLRRPLTRLEERLDLVERSQRAGSPEGQAEIDELRQRSERLAVELAPRLDAVQARFDETVERLLRARLVLGVGEQELEVPLGNVVELVWSNRLGPFARAWHALRHGVLFLTTEPRESNTEGGIFPALFGTVLMVFLMSLAVVPLGVVTAVYLTEYARAGRAAAAGRPGGQQPRRGAVDRLRHVRARLLRLQRRRRHRPAASSPTRLPTPTFGTGGILWASLTLALLTVPVVVVATAEGLLSVPRSRSATVARALGATRWQTLRRVVLPAAMPGILTGADPRRQPRRRRGRAADADRRGQAGAEPAARRHCRRSSTSSASSCTSASTSTTSSMQSPNVEAAKPMVYATALVLLVLVVLMNLTAIVIRRRLRRRLPRRGGVEIAMSETRVALSRTTSPASYGQRGAARGHRLGCRRAGSPP